MKYDNLPEEIKLHIFSFLNRADRRNLLLVNKDSSRLAIVSQCESLAKQLENHEYYISDVSFDELKRKFIDAYMYRIRNVGANKIVYAIHEDIAFTKMKENEFVILYAIASLYNVFAGTGFVPDYRLRMHKLRMDKTTGEIKSYETSLNGQTDYEENTSNHLLAKLGIELPPLQNTVAARQGRPGQQCRSRY